MKAWKILGIYQDEREKCGCQQAATSGRQKIKNIPNKISATSCRYTIVKHLILIILCLGFPPEIHAAEPTDEALLSAWENAQQADPKAEKFEKIETDLYHFKTRRFPYDGNLRVLNLSLEYQPGFGDDDFYLGVVEVELVDLPDDFYEKFAHSYAMWQQTNMLYFNPETDSWLTVKEWQDIVAEKYPPGWTSIWSGNLFWIIFIVILIVFLWLATGKARKQMDTAMVDQKKALSEQEKAIKMTEEALQLHRETNRMLTGILAILEEKQAKEKSEQ